MWGWGGGTTRARAGGRLLGVSDSKVDFFKPVDITSQHHYTNKFADHYTTKPSVHYTNKFTDHQTTGALHQTITTTNSHRPTNESRR